VQIGAGITILYLMTLHLPGLYDELRWFMLIEVVNVESVHAIYQVWYGIIKVEADRVYFFAMRRKGNA
jgi:hypothetical protein